MNGTLKKLFNYVFHHYIFKKKKKQNSRRRQLQAKLTFCGHEMFRN